MDVKLDVVYNPQYDDPKNAYTNCNINCLNMALRSKGGFPELGDKEMIALLEGPQAQAHADFLIRNGMGWIAAYKPGKLRQVWAMLEWAGRYVIGQGSLETGLPFCQFHYQSVPMGAIKDEIDSGYPVVLSGKFRAPQGGTVYDHIILAVGYNNWGLICHDPAGNLYETGAYFNGTPGADVVYPYEWLQDCLNGGRASKWALFVHADRGTPCTLTKKFGVGTRIN